MNTVGERLKWARQKAGYDSAAEAVRAFGWTKTTYADHENGHRQPKMPQLKRYAAAFTVPWLWLHEGGQLPGKRKPSQGDAIPVTGEVAAGQWLDTDVEVDSRDFDQFPIAAHPDFPFESQYGLIVKGTSMNKILAPGVVLHCVDIVKAEIDPLDDDIVIVQRMRHQGNQREITAKQINRRGKMIVLSPSSTESKWKPISFNPDDGHDGDEEVRVVALVIGRYTPMRRRK
ncbi:MAG: XRE family transcriptional regulator [Acidobacteriota bacterium]